MRGNKSALIVALSIVLCAGLFYPKFIFAAASVSLSGSTWALGDKNVSSESTSSANAWTVTNDSGGVEDVLIKVASTGSWTASADATPTTNEFLLRLDDSSGQIITGTDGNLVTSLANNGTDSFGLYFKTPPTGSQDGAHTLTITLTATNWVQNFVCGDNISVEHTTGTVAPVDKSVTYGTVATNLGTPFTGIYKCWITRNLGATNQASSATDNTEAAAGWYWQFNRKQGYKHDGTTRTPSTSLPTFIDEVSNWMPENDPCTLELGVGWRLPTLEEWYLADDSTYGGNWSSRTNTYSSVLKLHGAGFLNYFYDGTLDGRGDIGDYWSSTELDNLFGNYLGFGGSSSVIDSVEKSSPFTVRCIKDMVCGDSITVSHIASENVAPVDKTVTYGTVATNLAGPNSSTYKCWITRNLGAASQPSSATDNTEASSGWYWQFNRPQGYEYTTSRSHPWPGAVIDEDSDWTLSYLDPCTKLLGTGWRLPTQTEWIYADGTSGGSWDDYTEAYSSVLKLHAGGYLLYSNGELMSRGTQGFYWSSTQCDNTYAYMLNITYSASVTSEDLKTFGYSVRCLNDFVCGGNMTVSHTAGAVAPVTKTVTYGTASSILSGAAKCWITQNLGADHQATAHDDNTEASAGWYWQFNRQQGYKHDGATRTPSSTWVTSISENSNWSSANDPCTLLLGAGWRLPTGTEWDNADTSAFWYYDTYAYDSTLKLHDAGYFDLNTLTLQERGTSGWYWGSTQYDDTNGTRLHFTSSVCSLWNSDKAQGYSVRCLRDY